jgi:alpha-galactosidase
MGDALKELKRDMVFNLCQYGNGEVWKWGGDYGHLWRTTGDLGVATGSFVPGFYTIGMRNARHWQSARPGAWNDPDYIMIGWVGNARNMSTGIKITLTPNEQYAYMSLWSLMAAPLFFSGDMAKLDTFSLNVLCNHEVIAVDQDALGRQGQVIRNDSTGMVMMKPLADGSTAIGLFNFPGDTQNPADYFIWEAAGDGSRVIKCTAAELGIKGKFLVRDLWTQKDLGVFSSHVEVTVPYHGVRMLRIIPQ